MQKITSKDNSLIKHIMKLKNKKSRRVFNEYILEGSKIISEAIDEKANIKNIIVSEDAINSELITRYLNGKLNDFDCIVVSKAILKQITDVENPQGIVAIVQKKGNINKINYNEDFILAIDNIQDPGNLGTIIRTADSCNIKQILVSKGTVDVFNPKVIRSTMGAIFRVNIIECDNLVDTLKKIKLNNYKVVSTSLSSSKSIYDLDLKRKVIVIGNEANGISEEILNISDERAIIPMFGKTESLNASIAAGVIMYEYVRQKIQENS